MSLSIRPAIAADAALIVRFIMDLAVYEKLEHEAKASPADIARDLFGPAPKAFCDIAEWDGAPIGFALWFYTYSTFEGRHGIWLEDLFVDPSMRGKGAGKALLRNLAQRCVAESLGRLEWWVLDWNAPSIAFYAMQGAELQNDWTKCRVDGAALAKLGGRMSVAISMIAGVAANGVIGVNGGIPWRIPSDMAFFKRTTMGKPIIMGRKQYESVGRPLPGRTNLVVSRQAGYQPDGVIVINDLEAAIGHAIAIAEADRVDEAVIIGGGEIYAAAMGRADCLYVSHVALRPAGDVLFPEIDPAVWRIAAEPAVEASPRDEAIYRIAVYERYGRRGTG